ncbi:hypothetical protein F4859DRAFT_219043 [Xylaria cf. heliscus]|nr:hypothetical protein F4859DRAFT_219043 [Xylaria cf. heliscus]
MSAASGSKTAKKSEAKAKGKGKGKAQTSTAIVLKSVTSLIKSKETYSGNDPMDQYLTKMEYYTPQWWPTGETFKCMPAEFAVAKFNQMVLYKDYDKTWSKMIRKHIGSPPSIMFPAAKFLANNYNALAQYAGFGDDVNATRKLSYFLDVAGAGIMGAAREHFQAMDNDPIFPRKANAKKPSDMATPIALTVQRILEVLQSEESFVKKTRDKPKSWSNETELKDRTTLTEAQAALRLLDKFPELFIETGSKKDGKKTGVAYVAGHSVDDWYRALLLFRCFMLRRKGNMIKNLVEPTMPKLIQGGATTYVPHLVNRRVLRYLEENSFPSLQKEPKELLAKDSAEKPNDEQSDDDSDDDTDDDSDDDSDDGKKQADEEDGEQSSDGEPDNGKEQANVEADKEGEDATDQEDEDMADQENEDAADQEDEDMADQEDEDAADQEDEDVADQEDEDAADQEDEDAADQENEDMADQENEETANDEEPADAEGQASDKKQARNEEEPVNRKGKGKGKERAMDQERSSGSTSKDATGLPEFGYRGQTSSSSSDPAFANDKFADGYAKEIRHMFGFIYDNEETEHLSHPHWSTLDNMVDNHERIKWAIDLVKSTQQSNNDNNKRKGTKTGNAGGNEDGDDDVQIILGEGDTANNPHVIQDDNDAFGLDMDMS